MTCIKFRRLHTIVLHTIVSTMEKRFAFGGPKNVRADRFPGSLAVFRNGQSSDLRRLVPPKFQPPQPEVLKSVRIFANAPCQLRNRGFWSITRHPFAACGRSICSLPPNANFFP